MRSRRLQHRDKSKDALSFQLKSTPTTPPPAPVELEYVPAMQAVHAETPANTGFNQNLNLILYASKGNSPLPYWHAGSGSGYCLLMQNQVFRGCTSRQYVDLLIVTRVREPGRATGAPSSSTIIHVPR